MKKFKGYLDLEKYEFHQQQCLYALLFQEYLYAFAYDYGFNVSLFYESVGKLIGYNNKYSLILVKHLIHRIYQQNHLIYSWNHSKLNSLIEDNIFFYSHFDSQMISEGFGLVIDISFLLRLLSSSKKKEIPKLQNLRSIHSTFSFLEDKFSHFNYVSDILIPYPIHFKILVPILQYWIKDVPFLHLLQFFILQYSNRKTLINSKKGVSIFLRENKRFFRFIYNSYVSEYEFVFYFLHQKSSFFKFTFFGIFLERIYFYGKIENFKKVYLTSLQEILCFFTDSFIHYIRYKNKAIFSSRGTLLFMKKSKSYLVYFWQYYFHFWFQSNRILLNKFSNYFFDFLGYHISVKKNHLIVRVKILDNLVLIDTLNNKLDTLVPVIPLIRSLSKAKFCTTLGHPLSKPIWADLSDRDILNRFGQICRKILHYYSGSLKKRSLYRIKYILRLSCARTLARKHKIPVRTFMQKFGTTLLKEFFTEENKVFSLVFQKTIHFSLHKFHREPVWYLNIICINDFLDFS